MTQTIFLNADDVRDVARTLDGELFIPTAVDAAIGDVVELVVRLRRGHTVVASVAVIGREPWSIDREPGLLLRPLDDGDPLPGLLHDLARGRLLDVEERLAGRAPDVEATP